MSLINQTYLDWEALVVDDGGTDNTSEMVEGLGDHRIRYFWKPNEERSIARNFGIAAARGAYISFLDSDDYYMPEHLEAAQSQLSKKGYHFILHTRFSYVYPSGSTTPATAMLFDSDIVRSLTRNNNLTFVAAFVKSCLLKKHCFPCSADAVIAEDWCLWLQLASRYKIEFSPDLTACVRHHDQRSLLNVDPFKYERSLICVMKVLDHDFILQSRLGKATFAAFKARLILSIAQHFLIHRRRYPKLGITYLSRAVLQSSSVLANRTFWVCLKKICLTPVQIHRRHGLPVVP